MPRRRSLKPSYCRDKATDRAYVVIDGRRHYLGRFDSPESRDAYDRLIGEWIARGRRRPPPLPRPVGPPRGPRRLRPADGGVDRPRPPPPRPRGRRRRRLPRLRPDRRVLEARGGLPRRARGQAPPGPLPPRPSRR